MLSRKNIGFVCSCIVLLLFHVQLHGSDAKQQKTVFLTGAAGFIGSNFLRYMFEKYPTYYFIVLDVLTYAGSLDNIPESIRKSKRFEFIWGTITDQQVVDSCMSRADLVVNFAAESHVTRKETMPGYRSLAFPHLFIDANINGVLTLMLSLVKCKNVQRFIHISTSEVYGTAETVPMTEEHPLNPRTPYAASKAAGDRLVYSYWCCFDIPAVIVRPFNNYGPLQHPEKLIPCFITNALHGHPLTIHGDGSARRDWLHVLDTCEALDSMLHIQDFGIIKNEVINLGTGKSMSVHDIACYLKRYFALPESSIINQDDRPGQVALHVSSTEKSYKLLGWKAKRTFDNSINDLITWYKNDKDLNDLKRSSS